MGVPERFKEGARHSLIALGYRTNAGVHRKLKTLYNYNDLGRWVRESGQTLPPQVPTRYEIFEMALERTTGTKPLYLEFGVFEGTTLRWWSERLTQPGAHLIGFDSFEGLPEEWNPYNPPGTFAVESIPEFEDARVSLEAGWFDETLPKLILPDYDQLIVNIDADLYSSANFVPGHLEDALVPGTLLYFDEFSDRDHEFRALDEFVTRTGKNMVPLAMSRGGVHWLFEVAK